MELVNGMVEEAKEEIAKEDRADCIAGLKLLMRKVKHWNEDLERYKTRIQNDPVGAANEYRCDGGRMQ